MADDFSEAETPLADDGVGARLRAAREARGLTLEQLAAETRIPRRHLQVIEADDFGALPARTYAVGFSRTYARAVGLDENEVAARVRAELDAAYAAPGHRPAGFEPGDPARIPSRRLVWFVALALALLLAGSFAFLRTMFWPTAELPSLIEPEQAAPERAAAASPGPARAAVARGPVVFTALDDGIWIRFYEAGGQRLMEKQMARGESYTVPESANAPLAWTGRPDAFAITVGARAVPPLAEREGIMRDVPVTAQALLARPASGTAAPAAASPTT